jgi:hypothetical protein
VSDRRTWRVVVVSVVVWGAGVLVLGFDWDGIEVAPGVWRDAISLRRWSAFWAAVTCLGLASGPWVRTWSGRAGAILPLLIWLAVQLRSGTLAPIAWLIYATPTVAAWVAGGLAYDVVRRRWHAS